MGFWVRREVFVAVRAASSFLRLSVFNISIYLFIFPASAARCFAHIHIYGTAGIAETWAEHMLLQRVSAVAVHEGEV